MNSDNYKNLKLKYKILSRLPVLASFAIAGYPIWQATEKIYGYFGIPMDVPVNEQENGLIATLLFIALAVVVLTACYGFLTYVIAWRLKWTTGDYISVFWKNDYPDHWYKSETEIENSIESAAKKRKWNNFLIIILLLFSVYVLFID